MADFLDVLRAKRITTSSHDGELTCVYTYQAGITYEADVELCSQLDSADASHFLGQISAAMRRSYVEMLFDIHESTSTPRDLEYRSRRRPPSRERIEPFQDLLEEIDVLAATDDESVKVFFSGDGDVTFWIAPSSWESVFQGRNSTDKMRALLDRCSEVINKASDEYDVEVDKVKTKMRTELQ